MRTIRSVRRRVGAEARAAYLETLAALSKHEAEAGRIRGFYLVERDDDAGEFQEFWEYVDRVQACAHFDTAERDDAARALLRRLRELAPAQSTDSTLWEQRL